jgi:hypothetical protein
MKIPDHISESLETIFGMKILKFFDADADPGIFLIRNPGWKKIASGINKLDPQHYGTLSFFFYIKTVKAFYTMLTLSNCF